MQPFLKDVATYLVKDNNTSLEHYQLIVPSKRAGKFLLQHLHSLIKKPFWSPSICSISEFTSSFCPFKIEPSANLIAELYEACLQVELGSWESFDKFLKWGQLMLSDFNEIDSYLIDPSAFFVDLKNLKEIENWSLSSLTLSKSQQELADFWLKLGSYYRTFNRNLLKKNIGYQGMAAKYLAENIALISSEIKFQKIFFIGFNALSKAEQKTISYLTQNNKAEILWDIDSYYYNDPLNEAGLFFRRYKDLVPKKQYNLLATTKKQFEIIGVPQNIGQTDVAFSIIENLPQESLNKTLVALADENQIIPLLNACHNLAGSINASMGYDIKSSVIYELVHGLITLVKNSKLEKPNTTTTRYDLEDIQTVFGNYYMENFFKTNGVHEAHQNIIEYIRFHSFSSMELTEIDKLIPIASVKNLVSKINALTLNKENSKNFLEQFEKLINYLIEPFSNQLTSFENSFLQQIINAIGQVKKTFVSYPFLSSIDSVKFFLTQYLSGFSAPIIGDSMSGIQVMGMLESRALDFENVIMLSVNETIIPKAKTESSLIPNDIKRYYNLPTHIEKDAIYANHFYRLMQRAKRIYLLYNTETDDFGSGEQSRFITQLCHDLPKKNRQATITKSVYSPKLKIKKQRKLTIEKSDEIIEDIKRLLAKGVSPTMLSTFIKCPLHFYYQYILKLEKNESENQLSPPILGTCLHNSLEKSYLPFINQIISVESMTVIEKAAMKIYNNEIAEVLEKKFYQSGNNYMAFELGKIYLKKYFDFEKIFLKKLKGKELFLLQLEGLLNHQITLTSNNQSVEVNLLGKVDRIDKINDTLRIIDYKTGAVLSSDLSFDRVEDLFLAKNSTKSKALQVLMYGYLASKNLDISKGIDPMLISLKNIKDGYQGITIRKKEGNDIFHFFDEFEIGVLNTLNLMLDTTVPFTHNEEAKNCPFCSS